ncbi:unnamed protein product, partial [Closterium sp. Naga37s-1]
PLLESTHVLFRAHRRSVLVTAAVVLGTLSGNCRQRTRRHHCDRPPGAWIWKLVQRRAAMTYFHFFNCAALSFAPHLIFYKATPLSEYGTWTASLKAALVFFAAMLLKMILWASLLPESDHDPALAAPSHLDARQEALRAVIGAGVDLAGMRYALVHVSHRNMAFEHKFQAVGLGWALAESVSKRLVPLWVGAGGMEFKWDFLLDSLSSNIELVSTLTLAALASLLWLRRSKPPALVPLIYILASLLAALPFSSRLASAPLFLLLPPCIPTTPHAVPSLSPPMVLFTCTASAASFMSSISRLPLECHSQSLVTWQGKQHTHSNAATHLPSHPPCLPVCGFPRSFLEHGLGWQPYEVAGAHLAACIVAALITWRLFSACSRQPTPA